MKNNRWIWKRVIATDCGPVNPTTGFRNTAFIIWVICLVTFAAGCGEDPPVYPDPEVVAGPEFDPPAQLFHSAQDVTISCSTEGAVIYYTLDGTSPTDESQELSSPFVIRARAYHPNLSPSAIVDARYVILTSLIAYYPFSGHVLDMSGNSNNGAVYGATVTIDRNGSPASAYNFDGVNDFIELSNQNVFSMTDCTISMFFKVIDLPEPTGGDVFERYVLVNKGDGFGNYTISLGRRLGNSFGEIGFTNRTSSGNWTTSLGSYPIYANNWYHITIVAGDRIRLYVDGVLRGTSQERTPPVINNQDVLVGAYRASPEFIRYYRGDLDELRFYNSELSSEEVYELYLLETQQ